MPDTDQLPQEMEGGGAYFARGLDVRKGPVRRTLPDGGRAVTLGFRVCTADPMVGEEGAAEIARVLSCYDALVSALEPFAKAAESADTAAADRVSAWESPMAMSVTHGDFRAALGAYRQALGLAAPDTTGGQLGPGKTP